jgi:hypothetical protein
VLSIKDHEIFERREHQLYVSDQGPRRFQARRQFTRGPVRDGGCRSSRKAEQGTEGTDCETRRYPGGR